MNVRFDDLGGARRLLDEAEHPLIPFWDGIYYTVRGELAGINRVNDPVAKARALSASRRLLRILVAEGYPLQESLAQLEAGLNDIFEASVRLLIGRLADPALSDEDRRDVLAFLAGEDVVK
jgi:hypothetical protein